MRKGEGGGARSRRRGLGSSRGRAVQQSCTARARAHTCTGAQLAASRAPRAHASRPEWRVGPRATPRRAGAAPRARSSRWAPGSRCRAPRCGARRRDGEASRGAWDAFGAPLPPWPRDSVLSPAPTPLSAACKNPPRCSLHIAPRPRPWTPGSAPRGGAPRAARVYVSVCEAAARASRSIAARGAIHSAATDLHSARPPHPAPRCAPLSRPRRLWRVARCVLVGMEVGGVVDRRCHRERRVPWLSQVAAKASNPGRLVAGADPAACIVLAAGARRAAGAGEAHG